MAKSLNSKLRSLALVPLVILANGCREDCPERFRTQQARPQFESDFKQAYALTSTNGNQFPYESALQEVRKNTHDKYYEVSDIRPRSNKLQYYDYKYFDSKGFLALENHSSWYVVQDTQNRGLRVLILNAEKPSKK